GKAAAGRSFRSGKGGAKCRRGAAGGARRFPLIGRAYRGERQRREPLRDLEYAGEILRAFNITRQPIEVVGGTREHSIQAADHHRSRTQVSLLPPPWLELTTRDPFLSATRVSPPGTMRVRSRPVSTNGRRSTWRGGAP